MGKIVNEYDLQILLEKDEIICTIYTEFGAPPNWKREANFISLAIFFRIYNLCFDKLSMTPNYIVGKKPCQGFEP